MMHWWCTYDALMMRWWCADYLLMMCFWCPDDALMMQWWCTHDALMMHWWCTDDALSKIWCTGYDMMHIGQVSDLHGRFYGGRINGDKTWRRRPTDRVNIEQSASGRWTGRVLQLISEPSYVKLKLEEIYNLIFEHLTYSAILVPNWNTWQKYFSWTHFSTEMIETFWGGKEDASLARNKFGVYTDSRIARKG